MRWQKLISASRDVNKEILAPIPLNCLQSFDGVWTKKLWRSGFFVEASWNYTDEYGQKWKTLCNILAEKKTCFRLHFFMVLSRILLNSVWNEVKYLKHIEELWYLCEMIRLEERKLIWMKFIQENGKSTAENTSTLLHWITIVLLTLRNGIETISSQTRCEAVGSNPPTPIFMYPLTRALRSIPHIFRFSFTLVFCTTPHIFTFHLCR